MAIPPAPRRLVAIADRFARRLDELERRSDANLRAILRRSLAGTLQTLRRSYASYTAALGPQGYDPARNTIRRPGSYSAAEATSRFTAIIRDAQGFLPAPELRRWISTYYDDLAAATSLGGELGRALAELTGSATAGTFAAADPMVLRAAANNVGALIDGEAVRFRDQLVQVVGEGATRGWGPKKLELQVRQLLSGARDPKRLNQRLGLEQRAAMIARSELARTYSEATLARARERGDSYVRVLASNDERVCPTCAARNGRVFPTDRVILPFHPRCRCVAVFVPNEAVEERDPELQDTLLDAERWREEHDRGVEAYAKGRGITMEKARQELSKALNTPTASEKRLSLGRAQALGESVALFRG
jgi:SPP1 gp7 family putative phage head morphogenesis protein